MLLQRPGLNLPGQGDLICTRTCRQLNYNRCLATLCALQSTGLLRRLAHSVVVCLAQFSAGHLALRAHTHGERSAAVFD